MIEGHPPATAAGRETGSVDAGERARAEADAAARAAGVRVRAAETVADCAAVHQVFDAVWGGNLPPVNLIRALQHAGGYVTLAVEDDAVVGASLGFLGRDGAGVPLLHSHITAAAPGRAGAGLGYAIKLDQRAWCLERGITTVVWTFDPLVRRNAYFNLTKLGAVATAYHRDFYGSMPDAINEGDETDRLVATWRLDEPRADADAAGGVVVLDSDAEERPVLRGPMVAAVLLHRIPADIGALRDRDLSLHSAWRRAVRETLGATIDAGYAGVAMTRDGFYVTVRISERPA